MSSIRARAKSTGRMGLGLALRASGTVGTKDLMAWGGSCTRAGSTNWTGASSRSASRNLSICKTSTCTCITARIKARTRITGRSSAGASRTSSTMSTGRNGVCTRHVASISIRIG